MKLKKIIYNASLCAVALALSACNDIAEDDRFIYVEPASVAKRVLIEDFTGQRCSNCPAATVVIEQLQEEYGADNVIAVGLHSGPYGRNTPLRTDDGDWYYSHWGVDAQPTGMIDRQGRMTDISLWPGAVYNRIQENATVLLDASCSYDGQTRTVSIEISADGVADVNGNLQVWLTEDGIISPQLLEDGRTWNNDYVHNHVFRATVNDRMGDPISIKDKEHVNCSFTYTLDEEWVAENMSVVAFIYNDSGVLQTVKAQVIPTTGNEEGETEKEDAD